MNRELCASEFTNIRPCTLTSDVCRFPCVQPLFHFLPDSAVPLLLLHRGVSVPRNKGLRRGKKFAGDHRVSGEYAQHNLVQPLPPINRYSRRGHGCGRSPPPAPLSPHTVYKFGNKDGPFVKI
jgi:hypothetical protein